MQMGLGCVVCNGYPHRLQGLTAFSLFTGSRTGTFARFGVDPVQPPFFTLFITAPVVVNRVRAGFESAGTFYSR